MSTATSGAPGVSSVLIQERPVAPRLISIDVFRGMLVAGMVLVTNPGTYSYVYAPLKHADWNGATLTDMIFPSFLFLVGISMVYSFAARERKGEGTSTTARHVLLRSLGLIVFGLLLNLVDLLHVHDWRFPGVLQRIGLCYCAAGSVYLALRKSSGVARCALILVIAAGLVVVYWTLQTHVTVPGYGIGRLDAAATLSAYIDRAVFTTTHLWHWGGPGQMWDPEGLLTTLPAIANVLLGVVTGEWVCSVDSKWRKVLLLAMTGALFMVGALLLDPVVPINKKIWTPSFVLLSAGFSMLAFALLHGLIDLTGAGTRRLGRSVLTPALIYGSNAVLGFALANIVSPIFGVIRIGGKDGKPATIPELGFEWFSRFLGPWNASLAYAIVFVLLIMGMLWPLYRRRIFVRF